MSDEKDKKEHELAGEFGRRVAYSMLKPAAAIADRLGLSMADFVHLSQVAVYKQKRSRGMTLGDMASELDVSSRTLDRLVKAMRNNFFSPEREHELPRQIEFMLWSEPLSEARLNQLISTQEAADIREALESLLENERIEELEGRTITYRATRRANRILDDGLAARIDGLNNMLETIKDTVIRRFFAGDGRAGARTVALRVRPQDLAEIEAIYESAVWPKLVELDAAASDCDEAVEVGLTLVWSPRGDQEKQED